MSFHLLLRSAAGRRAVGSLFESLIATTAVGARREISSSGAGARIGRIIDAVSIRCSAASRSPFPTSRSFSASSSSAASSSSSVSGSGGNEDDPGKATPPKMPSDPAAASASPPAAGTSEWRSWIESRLSELDHDDDDEKEEEEEKEAAAAAAAAASSSAEAAERAAGAAAASTSATAEASDATGRGTTIPPPLPPPRLAVVEPHAADLPSPFTGYAELGESSSPFAPGGGGARRPGESASPPSSAFASRRPQLHATHSHNFSPGRIHPTRIFFPGQTYDPSDLVGDAGGASPSGGGAGAGGGAAASASSFLSPQFNQRRQPLPHKSTLFVPSGPRKTRTLVDFRDAKTLQSLLSQTGKLPPRRRTRLSQKHHRHLMRQVKLARQMALLHPLNNRERVDGGWFEGEEDEGKKAAAAAAAASLSSS